MSCDSCDIWKLAAEMVAHDVAFYSTYDETSQKHDEFTTSLCLNMNDVWHWACADAVEVPRHEMHEVYEIWKEHGDDGLLVWACKKRNARPQKPLFDKLKPELQALLKDLPRAGDVIVPVGDGKAATFDDGWGK